MSEALEVERVESGDILILKLRGKVTEDSNIEAINQGLKKIVVIDIGEVQRINSYGIRQWINVMKEIKESCQELIFHRCLPPFIEQFNMISNFGGGGVVYSFYLPFYNESEDKEELRLYSIPNGKSPEKFPNPNDVLSEEEKEILEFNDIEDEYFYFLQHQKGKTIDPKVISVLAK